MRIGEETIQKVNDIPIPSILQNNGIAFKKIGREFITVCPWHNDTNPSLTVNQDKNFCFCFACRAHGDGIAYVQQKFGLSFADAVTKIAEDFTIPIEAENDLKYKEALEKRRAILDLLVEQQESYRRNIRDPSLEKPREFLRDRGIEPKSSKEFGLGYSTSGFFRGRITIPVYSHRGTIVGFTARSVDNSQKPRYLNTVNNELFNKSELVFNEYRSSDAIRESDSVIFVEGHFDVITLWQHGVRNVVAMQGTGAPSNAVLNRLSIKTKRFVLCYDSDTGGQKAIDSFISVAGPMACQGKINITIAELPEGEDPDSYVKSNTNDFTYIIANARNWFDWQIERWIKQTDFNDTEQYTTLESKCKDFVDAITSPALRTCYIDKIAKLIAPEAKSASVIAHQWESHGHRKKPLSRWVKPSQAMVRSEAERKLVRLYIHYPGLRDELRYLLPKVQSPPLKWLVGIITQIEDYGNLCPESVLGALLVSDVHYLRQLRPVAMPTISLRRDDGILIHIKRVMVDG